MPRIRLVAACVALWLVFAVPALPADTPPGGVLPTDETGKPLNLDFEKGTLEDWTVTGDAFADQPINGDAVHARRADMRSGQAGNFWVGTYERKNDPATGTLASRPFKVTHPYASFLVGGGYHLDTRVELIRQDTGKAFFQASGDKVPSTDGTEEMHRVVADLSAVRGQMIIVRLVDQNRGHWGHINFDDFKFHDSKPNIPARLVQAPQVPTTDLYAHAGLSPLEAAKAMTLPPGFKATLFAGEPDVVQPIAFAIDDRGRLWVAEAYSYPKRAPEAEAKDRILIFEDTDGDGHFDKRKVFIDKLNLVSGLELGFGGVWVGAAPEFLFIPDKNGDDVPDGAPQVLLNGWGYEDTHETLNSFTWGPDGWLYGCHGVFTHSKVGKPGTPDSDRTLLNAGIWRYHPTNHQFEVFAHGTSNPWGVDFDDNGQAFLTSCVIPHLYHIIQGGRYERQGGSHFNPYTYDDIKTIADHRHYVGDIREHAWWGHTPMPPMATVSAGGGHAHAGAMIYLGGSWPAEYRGSIFMNNIHGARLNRDVLKPAGSGFIGSHAPDFLLANDSWSQIVNLKYGPDGSMFMIDWYDKNQCHRVEDVHDRTNGRIFKVSYGDAKPSAVDLGSLSNQELAKLVSHPNDWYVRHARRILQERKAADITAEVATVAKTHPEERVRLRALWLLHTIGSRDTVTDDCLKDPGPYVRAWAIQLAMEDGKPSARLLAKLAELAKSDPSPVVRLYLASALQKVPVEKRWEILTPLTQRAGDATDHNLPFMYWYAAAPLAEADAARALDVATRSNVAPLLPFMVRRIGAIGSPDAIALLVDGMGKPKDRAVRLTILRGLNEALKGRRQVDMPSAWPNTFAALLAGADAETRSQATALAVTFGDPAALQTLHGVLMNRTGSIASRREALDALLKARAPGLATTLRTLLDEPELRGSALRGLAAIDDPKTPGAILNIYTRLSAPDRRDALNTLAARADFAKALLAAVGDKSVPATDLSADVIRQLRNLKSKDIDEHITKVWGAVRETTADRTKLIAQTKAMLLAKPAQPPDLSMGRTVFSKTCQQCHTLFGVGGKVGPEITGSNRADLDYLLSNVLDSSALIGKDYIAHVIATADGRVLTGIVRGEDKDAITLVTANETLTVPKAEVENRKPSELSMMPDDLLKPLSEHEIRSLVAYLASPGQVPPLLTKDNISGFFNRRDLSGWLGDPKLWSVENGEIVGRTAGLARNEFLRSDAVAGDFRLVVQVKLVKNEGNSGIQFRSEPLPDGEMKGYQADIGPGWWGKLYEENGRALLWRETSGEKAVKPGEWNEYIVQARGSKIDTWINGTHAVDLDDPPGARRGLFAFQLHSGGPTEVRLRIVELETPDGGKWSSTGDARATPER
jgi:putative membrane-bound dehydrogenase-like protein